MKLIASVPTAARSITFRRHERRPIARLATLAAAICLAALASVHVGATPRDSPQPQLGVGIPSRNVPIETQTIAIPSGRRRTRHQAPARNVPIEIQTLAIPPDPIDPNQPIEPSALIEISVDQEPEPSGKYLVDPDGNIPVLIAFQNHPVSVRDQTPAQAAVTLTTFLKQYLKNPTVRVTVIAAARPIVSVTGGVLFPGPMRINRHTSLADLLHVAGFNDYSDLSQVRLTRHKSVNGVDKPLTMTLHIGQSLLPTPGKAVDAMQNPLLQDKDEIFVPFKNGGIAITGAVLYPTQGLLPRPKMTLMEAIDLVGGTIPGWGLTIRHASIQRGTRKIVVLLDEAYRNDPANNIVLQPGDVVHVEPVELDAFQTTG